MLVLQYLDQNGWTTILAAKKSAGVAPEANPRIRLHTGGEAGKRGVHPVFETGLMSPESKTGATKLNGRGKHSKITGNFIFFKVCQPCGKLKLKVVASLCV